MVPRDDTLPDSPMKTTHISCFNRLGAIVGLGLSLTMAGCGASADDTTTTSSTTTGTTSTTGGSSTSTDAPTTSGATTGSTTTSSPSTSSTTTDDPTTGAPITSSTTTSSTSDPSTSDEGSSSGTTGDVDDPAMSFFVSSTGSPTGDLGGLAGADKRCQDLADAVGAGDKTWHAYLSIEFGPDDQPVHARDRIGEGPWYNAALVMLAPDLATLHTIDGDHELFLDENGEMVNGQWADSPDPNEHDIFTGSNKDGTVVPGKTCADWTSDDPTLFAQVGHSDGLGPNMNDAEMYRPWNSVHESGGCHDTAPKGGAGKVYCFAID
jgi:hypothetical protein